MAARFHVRPMAVADALVFLAAKNRPVSAASYCALLREVAGGRVVGGFVGGVPVAMGAVQTFTIDGPRVAWVSVVEGVVLPARPLLRAIVAYLAEVGVDRVTALVAVDQPQHQRFVRLSGFRPTGQVVAGLEIWVCERDHRKDRQEAIRAGPAGPAAAGAAAG